MIEIITSDGVTLDLDKSASFAIEIENPMLDDTGIPVAFSTPVTFLPTLTNIKVFGWVDFMMCEPENKTIAVSIHLSGIPIFSGSLVYDSIEDGKLNYTFNERDLEDNLTGKIHEVSHMLREVDPYLIGGDGRRGAHPLDDIAEKAKMGEYDGWAAPIIVGKEQLVYCSASGTDAAHDHIDANVKYRNWPTFVYSSSFMPAVKVKYILEKILDGVEIGEDIRGLFEMIAVPGTYSRPDSSRGYNKIDSHLVLDLADMLPDCDMSSFLSNILKILCASLLVDGNRYVILSKKTILDSNAVMDLSEKISDQYSISKEEAQFYHFEYANDEDSVFDPDNAAYDTSNEIIDVPGLLEVADMVRRTEEYKSFRCVDTGDIYSGKMLCQPVMDLIYHNIRGIEKGSADNSSFDASCDFNLVSCVPVYAHRAVVNRTGDKYKDATGVVPIIPFNKLGEDRPTAIYVGLLIDNQMTDKGRVMFSNGEGIVWQYNRQVSLAPADLYESLHKPFADWISSDRQCLSVDLNLDAFDIAGIRMFHKVLIRGRQFVIKKLSYTFYAGSDKVEASGEFLSV